MSSIRPTSSIRACLPYKDFVHKRNSYGTVNIKPLYGINVKKSLQYIFMVKFSSPSQKDNCLSAIKDKPTNITKERWKEISDNVVVNLLLAMTDSILLSVIEKKITKEIWDAIIKLYEIKSLHTSIFFKRKLFTLERVNSYDQLIINITNNNMVNCLSFNDVVGVILEVKEEYRQKNKEDRLENSKHA
ncbi:hypothetical protein CR513_47776, partial [Mucuna pruriens]